MKISIAQLLEGQADTWAVRRFERRELQREYNARLVRMIDRVAPSARGDRKLSDAPKPRRPRP